MLPEGDGGRHFGRSNGSVGYEAFCRYGKAFHPPIHSSIHELQLHTHPVQLLVSISLTHTHSLFKDFIYIAYELQEQSYSTSLDVYFYRWSAEGLRPQKEIKKMR
jgi:hypothetical protein